MTVREKIRTSLLHNDLTLKELQRKICIMGYNFNTMKSTISRMLHVGEVINLGPYKKPLYSLNKGFIPKEKKQPLAPVCKVVHKKTKPYVAPAVQKPKEPNGIFNQCRNRSRIRNDIDIPLQAVRT